MANNPLRFVFIGCGKVAHYHADVIYAHKHKIVGVAARKNSKNIGIFADKYNIKSRYSDFNLLFKELKPDAVIVCVSWDQIRIIIKDVIDFGYPVLVEKPIALSSNEVMEIYDQTIDNTDKVLVGYNRRFYDFIPDLKLAIQEQHLNSVQLVLPESLKPSILKTQSEKSTEDHMLTYKSSHWLDLLIYLLGDIKVSYMHNVTRFGAKYESHHGLLTTKESGVPIHYISDFNTFQNMSITFVFDNSVWIFSPLEVLSIFNNIDKIDPTEEIPIRQYKPRLQKKIHTNLVYKPGFYNQMDYFIKYNILGKSQKNITGATLKQSIESTKLAEAIQVIT
jgi:predicted dehydrogenase